MDGLKITLRNQAEKVVNRLAEEQGKSAEQIVAEAIRMYEIAHEEKKMKRKLFSVQIFFGIFGRPVKEFVIPPPEITEQST